MLRRIFVFASLFTFACGSPPSGDPSASTDSAYSSGQFQKMLTCNGGAAVLDADTGERRQVQFVIRDPNAINWLTGQVGMQLGPLNRGNGRELIVSGRSDNGLFSPGDFHSMSQPFIDAGDAQVFRDGRGIKVVFRRDDGVQGGFCTDNQGGEPGGCIGGWAGGTRVYHELANWYFDDCR